MRLPIRIAFSLLLYALLATPLTFTASAQTTTTLLSEDFEGQSDLSPFSSVSVTSDENWTLESFSGDQFAEMNGFNADTDSEDWLISPAFDFSSSSGETLNFQHTRGFSGGSFEILFSTDYTGSGDPNAATWTNVTSQATLSPGDNNEVSSGDIDISSTASSVYIAFKYTSGPSNAARHQVDDLEVTVETSDPVLTFSSTTATVGEGDGTATLTVELAQPNGSAIDVDVALSSGDAADVGGYATQTVSFPSTASAGATQNVTVSITDDSDLEADETFMFALENPTGGAVLGTDDQFTLTITDNDGSIDLVINEIHADPAGDLSGDANGDGTRDFSDDEFVEIYNNGSSAVDIGGFQIEDGAGSRHTVPSGTVLDPGVALVVFGGGTPTGIPGVVQTASSGALGLNNGGDTVTLLDGGGGTLATVTYGSEGGNDQSLTRSPDFTGSFAEHSTATGSGGALFSPGQTVDGDNLPVELATFEVSASGRDAELRWTTASETNNAGFHVLHRSPGADWGAAGFVEGAGTATTLSAYTLSVSDLKPGVHRFRLEQVDLDGATTLHEPREIRIAAQTSVTLSGPNPLRGGTAAQLTIEVARDQQVEAGLYNVLGQRVRTLYAGPVAPSRQLDVSLTTSGLASGLYFVRVIGDDLRVTERISIVR